MPYAIYLDANLPLTKDALLQGWSGEVQNMLEPFDRKPVPAPFSCVTVTNFSRH